MLGAQPRTDHVAVLRPAAAGRITGPEDSFLATSYLLDAQKFLHDEALDALNHQWFAGARLASQRWGYVQASNFYVNTNDRAGTVFADRIRREDDTVKAAIGKELGSLTPELGYEFFKGRYRAPIFLHYTVSSLAPRATWKADENNEGLLDARWDHVTYPDATVRDGNAYEARFGWSHRRERLALSAAAGAHRRVYRGGGVNGYFGPVGEARARWTPEDRTTLSAGYAMTLHEAPVEFPSAYYREQQITAAVAYRATERLSAQLSQIVSIQKYGNNSAAPGLAAQRRDVPISTDLTGNLRLRESITTFAGLRRDERFSNLSAARYHGWVATLGCKIETR
ncbi:MAG: outer membrane beta-barrel protein [Elusimicrobia bacterium]|nr:outer membrane beta-barrel protein [Elusimicrobiota bacterium]